MLKEYIGDSVYVECDGYGFILTTENGLPDDPSNKIYLEPEILDNLIAYRDRIVKHFRDHEKPLDISAKL